MAERFLTHFAASDWHAVAEMLADNFSNDDRRRVVGAGVRHGRDAQIADMRAIADLWITTFTATSMAIRGKHLVLMRAGISFRDQGPESFVTEVLGIVEINGDEQIVALVSFDPDDFDAAFAELDARYLAGEAASHAHTWSVISECFATLSRHELPSTTTDLVDIDHRRGAAFAPGELLRYVHAGWEINQSTRTYAEVVHRLNDLGAVVTHAADLISRDGFEAEWRTIDIFTIEGDLINRCEIFDESDLDAALARFDELHPQTPRLENTASQVAERFQTHFVASDWDAIAETLADNFCGDDRRRVVGAGVRHGREAQTVAMRATADLWIAKVTSTVIATRGKRLALIRGRFWNRDQSTEAFLSEVLAIVEINTDERIVAIVSFDPDDIDAAFAELDARYLAGEAAAHARMWSVIADAFAAINRHEIPAATKDYVIVDHQLQHTAVEASGLTEYLNASWDLTPDLRMHIEAVHQLSDLGAVITLALHGTSQEGFEAEWRIVELLTGEGDVGKRCEIFAEADLPAALARFEELHPQARRLENAATRATERSRAALAARDWDAMTSLLAEGFSSEDRRRVVNTGMRRGRDVGVKDLQAAVDVIGIVYLTSVVIATRGERLELISARVGNDERPEAVQFDILQVTEIDADERIAAVVTLDGDDLDAAVAELDARYLAGEAASHAQTWSVVAAAYRAVNRCEAPATTSDWTMIDHRPIATFEADDLPAFLDATWTLTSDINLYIEAVHRLSDLGAVVTHASHGTSREGLDVEWHDINLVTVDGDLLRSCEIFDQADIDGAVARFDELHRPVSRLENAASRVHERFMAHYEARDWNAIAETLPDDHYLDDRRRVVNAGIRHGRDAEIANMQTAAGVGTRNVTSVVIATRGTRLALSRSRFSGRDQRPDVFHAEVLNVVEIDPDERIAAFVLFDLDDVDAALEELDARYLAGEAAAHSHTWSVIARTNAEFNRHEIHEVQWVTIDHRRLVTADTSDMPALFRSAWDLTPDLTIRIDAVLRLSSFGAVVTRTGYGTSPEGFDAEWRMIHVLTVEGDRVDRCDIYDEGDLDAALIKFEELQPEAGRLKNVASQVIKRFQAHFAARNWAAIAQVSADDIVNDDRRSVVGSWDSCTDEISTSRTYGRSPTSARPI